MCYGASGRPDRGSDVVCGECRKFAMDEICHMVGDCDLLVDGHSRSCDHLGPSSDCRGPSDESYCPSDGHLHPCSWRIGTG